MIADPSQRIKVSIIMPVLNARSTLMSAIDSVQHFKTDQVELIVLDGGSTDGSLDILRRCMHVIDILDCGPDHGIYDAMNKGVSLARGNWCLFLGADDILLDGFRMAMDELLRENCNYYGNVRLASTGRIYNKRYTYLKLVSANIPHQAIFYLASMLRRSPFDNRYRYLADYANNLILFRKYPFLYTDCVVARYNDETGVSSISDDDVFKADKGMLICRGGWPLARLYCALRRVRLSLSTLKL